MSSNIPMAREIIQMVLAICNLDAVTRRHLHRALALMTRAKPIRRAPAKRTKIDPPTRRKVHNLAHINEMTIHEIADATGLRNSGRVSEILNRKR